MNCTQRIELSAEHDGNWFPVNFPSENFKTTFHFLTHHVPRQAHILQSTGIITEQTKESIHLHINDFSRSIKELQIGLLLQSSEQLATKQKPRTLRTVSTHHYYQVLVLKEKWLTLQAKDRNWKWGGKGKIEYRERWDGNWLDGRKVHKSSKACSANCKDQISIR